MKNVFYQTETARGSASPQAATPRRLRAKRLIALAAALLCGMNWAWAQNVNYNLTYQCGSNTLYLLIDKYAKTAAVVCPEVTWSGTPGYTYHPKPTGVLEIPMSVIFGDIPCTVTAIEEKAFMSCSGITSVSIPSSVTSIRPYAFDGCTSLTSVNIPNSVTSIPGSAFRDCTSLASVTIPNSVTEIGDFAFQGCTSLTSVNIPNSVTSIAMGTFVYCTGLTSVNIPNSVTSIGNSAFCDCTGLTSIVLPNSVTTIGANAFADCTSLASWNIPNSVTSIGASAFKNCNPNSSSISISRFVTNLGSEAFAGCGFTTVSLYSNDVVSNNYGTTDYDYKGFYNIFGNQVRHYTIGDLVTEIGEYAFADCTGLTSVSIPGSVTSISARSFYGCSGLTSVTLPNSLTIISTSAFENCTGLTSVTLPNSVIGIGDDAFKGVNLTSITLPSSLISLGNAFANCANLTSVTINSNAVASKEYYYSNLGGSNVENFRTLFGNQVTSYTFGPSVTDIGTYALHSCTGMTEVSFSENLTSIGSYAFNNCTGLTEVSFPNSPTSISWSAFENCTGLTSVSVGSSLRFIGKWAFKNTGITRVDITPSVYRIENYAFENCPNLTYVYINSNDVASKEYSYSTGSTDYNFRTIFGNQVETYTFGSAVLAIGEYALYNCTGMTRVIFYGNQTTIGHNAFNSCTGLTSLTLPNSVTTIGSNAFSHCNGLTSLTLPNSLTSIGYQTFKACSGLTSVIFPNSLTSIGLDAFSGCTGLTSLNFPNSLTSIGENAFSGCTGLTTLKFPNSLTSIDRYAFSGCTNIQTMTVRAVEPPTAYANTFENVPKNIPVYVPSGSIQAYKSATGWEDFYNISDESYIVFADGTVQGICLQNWDTNNDGKLSYIEAEDITDIGTLFKGKIIHSFDELQYFTGLTSIPSNAFEGCAALTSITFPNSLTSINSSAFKNCANLSSIVIPSSVTYFGGAALIGCTELAQIVVESGNTKYDSRNNCNAIIETADNTLIAGCKTTVIPDDVTSIGGYAFYNCTGLTSIEIPNTVTYIRWYAFEGCTGLTSIQLPSSLTTIGESAFRSCSGLTSITIPNLVTTIGENAFLFCSGLTSLVIGSSVTTIGNYAFSGCRAIERITVLATTPPPMNNSTAFSSTPSSTPLYVPCGTSEAYQNATCWSGFKNIVEVCNIEFEDPLVKAICVANWDTNGDGELSMVEAEAVTDLNYQFYRKDITSFNELQYFTGLTDIGYDAFSDCFDLTSITIPSSVTSIGSYAFQGCTGLAQIVVESGNTVYDSRNNCNAIIETATNTLFAGCKTTVIPSDVTTIGERAFAGCTGLTSIEIPNSVTAIKYAAFSQCTGLTSVEIPQSITSIKYFAFAGCTGLESITVLATTPPTLEYYAFADVPTNIPVYVPCGSRDAYIAAEGLSEFTNIGGDCYIEFEDQLVKDICVANWDTNGDDELSYAEAAQVTDLGTWFQDNGIVRFNELQYFTGLSEIGEDAFMECEQLASIILPEGVTTIGREAFAGCKELKSIIIPENVTTISLFAFYLSGLESIVIPANVTEIVGAFIQCPLQSITVHPDNLTYTSNNGCNVIVEMATNKLIVGCANSDIYEGIEAIEEGAFAYNTEITTLELPSTLQTIGVQAFQGCSNLQTMELPANLTSIGNGAFYACRNLAEITCRAEVPPTLGTDAFKLVSTNIPVYVPCGSLAAYQSAEGWSTFTNIQEDCNITLTITGYGDDPTTTEGWHLITSPLEGVSPENVGNMLSNNYDLYQFHGGFEGAEWRNYKNNENNGFTMLYAGDGYLYANSEDVTLEFIGSVLNLQEYSVYLIKNDDTRFGNWNLVGNPFTTEATVSKTDYYRIEPGTRTLMPSSGNVNPMEGIFVEANEDSELVTFTKLTRGERAIESPMVNIDLRNAEGRLLDRARLRLGEGNNLGKLDMLSDPNRLYFRIDGKDYAVARVNGQGEMPLHFDAAQNGTFTLNVNVEGMELSYLHLIDNMTGEDIDLLAQNGGDARHCVSTYTFTGKPSDYASRFRLVFETGSIAEGDSFAFIDAAGNIVITNTEAGATLQVIDVTGRVVVSTDVARGVSTNGMTAGVYVLRLINGNDVMTQKIVVE